MQILLTSSALLSYLFALFIPQMASSSVPFLSIQEKVNELEIGTQAAQFLKSDPKVAHLARTKKFQMTPQRIVKGKFFHTTKFQNFYQGVEILGSVALVHSSQKRSKVTHHHLSFFDLNTQPSISSYEAYLISKSHVGDRRLKNRPELKILPPTDDRDAKLVYWITLDETETDGGYDLIINAHSGELIAKIPHRQTLAPISVYSAKEVPDLFVDHHTGEPFGLPEAFLKEVITDSESLPAEIEENALRAFENAVKTRDYFLSKFDHNGFDQQGHEIKNIVDVGRNWVNAYWDSENNIMAYGNGDGETFGDMTLGLDVAGHEMTHGIISHSAELLWFGESGAVNEGYADYFGKMIENKDSWIMGKDLYIDPEQAKGIRDLEDPNRIKTHYHSIGKGVKEASYPKHLDQKFVATGPCEPSVNDSCWTHVNSTIVSHAAYLVHQKIGKEKTELLYYTTLTQFLGAQSGIRSSFHSTLEACDLLFDENTCEEVKVVFESVGM